MIIYRETYVNRSGYGGAHQLEAHKYLGREQIVVSYKDVDQLMGSLVEVYENLAWAELTDIQMSRQLNLRDEILE